MDIAASAVMVFRRSSGGAEFDAAFELGVEDELASPRLPGFALALSSLLGA